MSETPAVEPVAAAPVTETVETTPMMGTGADNTSTPAPTGSWREGLPDNLRNDPSVTRYNSLEDAVGGMVSAQKLIGQDKIIKPVNDSPEELNRYHQALGRPDESTGYDYTGLNAGGGEEGEALANDLPTLQKMSTAFHGLGLDNKQARGVVNAFEQMVAEGEAEMKANNLANTESETASMKSRWGNAYEGNQVLAERAGKSIFGEGLLNQIADAKNADGVQFGSTAEFVDALHKAGAGMSEDGLSKGALPTARTPQEAMAQYNKNLDMNGEFGKVIFDLSHPDNEKYQAIQSALMAEAKAGGEL